MKKPKTKHSNGCHLPAKSEDDQNEETTNGQKIAADTTESKDSTTRTIIVNDSNAESMAASAAAIALSALNNDHQLEDSPKSETDVEAQMQRELPSEIPLVYSVGDHQGPSTEQDLTNAVLPKNVPSKNKRKADSAKKEYIDGEPTEHDVLMGRGGRSNHHPGNARYLQEKLKIQTRYRAATKDEKTIISQELVDAVGSWGGRFLKQDVSKWYKVDNTTARKKASQTLREDNTPEHRAQKRAKYSAAGNTPPSSVKVDGVVVEGAGTIVVVEAEATTGAHEGGATETPTAPAAHEVVVQEASV